jgi:hypothetical protein
MKKIETKPGIRILKNDNYCGSRLPDFLKEPEVRHIRRFHEHSGFPCDSAGKTGRARRKAG